MTAAAPAERTDAEAAGTPASWLDRHPTLRRRVLLVRALRHGGGLVGVLALGVVVQSLIPAAFALSLGLAVGRVGDAVAGGRGSPAAGRLLGAVSLILALTVLERMVAPVVEATKASVARRIDGALRAESLAIAHDGIPLVEFEGPEVQDLVGMARGSFFGTPGAAAAGLVQLGGRYLQTGIALAIVAQLGWWVAAILFGLLFMIRRRWQRRFMALSDTIMEAGGVLRRASYFVDLAVGPHAAKELRVFGLTDFLVGRSHHHWEEAVAAPLRARSELRRSANLELAILTGAYLVAFVLLAQAAANGSLGVAMVAAIGQSTFVSAQIIVPWDDDFAMEHGQSAIDVPGRLETLARGPAAAAAPVPVEVPAVRFEGVSFTYPGASAPVLDGVDLELRPGESLALVGGNGEGKSTLVKMLAGLYEPTAGRVLVDGIDLRQIDEAAWRQRCAIVFQDFLRYELSARDNVGFGAVEGPDSTEALDAAAGRAGASAIVAGLPQGWDTVLSAQHEGGTDLSGGQWQRIGLARALLAVEGRARLLVLDEPTANLDVRAEAELVAQLDRLTAGTTRLLISHRLSTVRAADRIALLRGGRITELGSHAELMALGGRYAEMFTRQSQQFADPAPTGEGGLDG